MAFQPAQNCALAELQFAGPGGIYWQNNIHFVKANFEVGDMQSLATNINGAWVSDDIRDVTSADVTLQRTVVTDLRTQGATQVTNTSGIAGLNGTDMAAQGAACVVTLRTALRGRSYRGRTYVCGLTEGSLVDGAWTAAVVTKVEGWLTNLRQQGATVGWTMVVLSRQINGVERPTALGEAVLSSEVRSLLPGSQRRRNRRP